MLYGTAWRNEKTRELVLMALRYGFRALDTAAQPSVYDEAGLGEALYVSDKLPKVAGGDLQRAAVWLQTKFVPLSEHDIHSVPYDSEASVAVQVEQSTLGSLRNLRTSYVDCLLLSQPYPTHEETMLAWRAMEAQVANGNALSLGLSNCYDLESLKKVYDEATVKPKVLQNRFVRETGFDVSLRQFCSQRGIQYQSFGTISGNEEVINSNEVWNIAERLVATPAVTWITFVRALGVVPVTETTVEEEMRDDLMLPVLNPLEIRRLCEMLNIPAPKGLITPWDQAKSMGHLRKPPWLGADKPTCNDEGLMASLRSAMANVSSTGDGPGDVGPGFTDPFGGGFGSFLGRRRLAADADAVADGGSWWAEEWERRFSCWWLGLPLPTQGQVGACLGALSLHLGSRLEAVLGRTLPPSAAAAPVAEPRCEWIGEDAAELELPDFPSLLPSAMDFSVPPLPRLLPSWQQLQSLAAPGKGALAMGSQETPPYSGGQESLTPPSLDAAPGEGALAMGSQGTPPYSSGHEILPPSLGGFSGSAGGAEGVRAPLWPAAAGVALGASGALLLIGGLGVVRSRRQRRGHT